jgi:lysophospholipase L1-like esterase
MKYILIAIVVILILFSFSKKETNIQALTSQDSILAFGDSLTYGYNAKPNESYPNILSHLSGYRVINEGVLGDTSIEGLKRLAPLLEEHSIKLLILCFGGNDMLQGLSKENLKNNLKTMIQMAKEKNIEVLLISVPNLELFGLSAMELYEEVAEEENIPLLSGLLADILEHPSLKSDQVHPNAEGYKIMAERIYKKLKEEGFIN